MPESRLVNPMTGRPLASTIEPAVEELYEEWKLTNFQNTQTQVLVPGAMLVVWKDGDQAQVTVIGGSSVMPLKDFIGKCLEAQLRAKEEGFTLTPPAGDEPPFVQLERL